MLKIPLPEVPSYPAEVKLDFLEKGRDKFLSKFNEALARKRWEQFGSAAQEEKRAGYRDGIHGIFKEHKEDDQKRHAMISNSFTGLDALRESATKLVLL